MIRRVDLSVGQRLAVGFGVVAVVVMLLAAVAVLTGVGVRAQADYRATVREYLAREIPEGDEDRAALLELADTFMTTPGGTQ